MSDSDAPLVSLAARAFVPARDFELSRRFYAAVGFTEAWVASGHALFEHGASSFLLQDFHVPACTSNFQMQLLVEDVDAWWHRMSRAAAPFDVRIDPPEDRPWGMRDFPLFDPSGVLWRIGQPIRP